MIGNVQLTLFGLVVAALVVQLVGERRDLFPLRAGAKLVGSAAFVALGIVRWSAGDTIGTWIVLALVVCAVGDGVLLLKRGLALGIGVFLLGHVAYIVAFQAAVPARVWSPLLLIPVLAAGLTAAWWLWPHLGRLRYAVAAYITVISVMTWGALAATVIGPLPWQAGVGAVLFFLSDVTVARNRFVEHAFVNRAMGLPAYYAGQVLLATVVGAVAP